MLRRMRCARTHIQHTSAASYTIYCLVLPFPYTLTLSFYSLNFRRRLLRSLRVDCFHYKWLHRHRRRTCRMCAVRRHQQTVYILFHELEMFQTFVCFTYNNTLCILDFGSGRRNGKLQCSATLGQWCWFRGLHSNYYEHTHTLTHNVRPSRCATVIILIAQPKPLLRATDTMRIIPEMEAFILKTCATNIFTNL